jgi:Uma2 family endonuclease
MTTMTKLLTADEFLLLPADGPPKELVRGELVPMNVPTPRHGQICVNIAWLQKQHAKEHQLGHVVSNDSGVLTERDPDTVRGADVAFYRYTRVPPGPLPQGYLPVPPDLVFEVRSLTDRWSAVHAKVAEYLQAGVAVVCVVDEPSQSVHVFDAARSPRILGEDEEFALPELLGDFRVAVRRFFE